MVAFYYRLLKHRHFALASSLNEKLMEGNIRRGGRHKEAKEKGGNMVITAQLHDKYR